MAQAETRKLAAIMFTDIAGFSRQMGTDEARTLRLLAAHNHVIQQAVTEHHGHVIKTVGDAFLVDFPSVVHAVQCAQRIHAQFHTHNYSIEAAWRPTQPFKDPAVLERFFAAARKAGLK
jgi:class 3 adenylate cyclase